MNSEIHTVDLGMVNAFLARTNDGFILIDTGMSRQWEKLEAVLLKEGCLPSGIKLVLITHGDSDHTGNCAVLQKKYGLKIAMHRGDLAMVQNGAFPELHARSFSGKIMLFLVKAANRKATFGTFQPDIFLEDGQDLVEYGFDAKVVHTPGHTTGSVAILTGKGNLLAGDTVSNRLRPGLAPFVQDRRELEASFAKLKALKASEVYPGHGKPFPFEKLLEIQ
jgi:hydroxyacylglutathione hydrolase